MHERCALDLRLKHTQPKKSPRIERLRGPLTKNEPAEFPQRAQSAWPARDKQKFAPTETLLLRLLHRRLVREKQPGRARRPHFAAIGADKLHRRRPLWNPSNQQLRVSNQQTRRCATARMLLPEGA